MPSQFLHSRDPQAILLQRLTPLATDTPMGMSPTGGFVSEPAYRVSQSALRILQWNADGLSPKVQELRQRLQVGKIDICLIQETKLIS